MVIAFDTFFLSERFRNVGINEYAKNLFVEFQALASMQHSIAFRHFVSPQEGSPQPVSVGHQNGFQSVATPFLDWPWLWRLGLVNYSASRARADLLFSPSPQIVPWGLLPVAVTIHDTIPLKLPRDVVGGSAGLRAFMRVAAKSAVKIFTDSECSRADLVEVYGLSPEKVSVVYLGYNKHVFNAQPADSSVQATLREKLGIRGPYILHHGMVQLRKNILKLISAFNILLSTYPNFDFQLVLAGKLGYGSQQILQAAGDLISRKRVVFAGPLTDEDLAHLIKGASLSVIPSLYEGFCLPMVESMACGVPTVAANTSCLPEVSGDQLRYFDPRSDEDIASTMDAVLNDTTLQATLITGGLRRAAQFSWQRCARETFAILASLDQNNVNARSRHFQ